MSERRPFPGDYLNEAGLNRQFVFNLRDLPADIVDKLAPQAGERQLIGRGEPGQEAVDRERGRRMGGAQPRAVDRIW